MLARTLSRPVARFAGFTAVLGAACHAATPPPPAVPANFGSPAATAPLVGPTGRGPSEAIRKYWPFTEELDLILYADLRGLFASGTGATVVPTALTLAGGSLGADASKCLRDVAASAQELLFGATEAGGLLIVRFDEGASQPNACFAALGAKPTPLPGADDAYGTGSGYLVHRPGFVLLGDRKRLLGALQQAAPAPAPPALELQTDQYVAWASHPEPPTHLKGRMLVSPSKLRIDVEGDMPEATAAGIEPQVARWKAAAPAAGKAAGFGAEWQRVVDALVVERNGGHVRGVFELAEPAADQARDVGMAAAVAIHEVRAYINASKQAEARVFLREITKDYVAYWEREDPPTAKPKPKKLLSFPPVPATVPRGQKYQSSPDEWKDWAPIQFSPFAPQYYQYEVIAAKDGKSVEILARGDLNGDGKTSLFRQRIQVDPVKRTLTVAAKLEEIDPDE